MIIWSPQAKADADEAAGYIAHDRPEAALEWLVGLRQAIGRLAEYPESGGRTLALYRKPVVRELIYTSYRVIYRVVENDVRIERIWHSRRKLRKRDVPLT